MNAAWLDRDALVVSGPEATDYLQGQLSQDVTAVEVGASAWSWVLQPSGKVDALVRVTRTADAWVLDTDAGFGAPLVARLNRFKLRTKVDIEAPAWRCLGLRGDDAEATGADFEVAADATWGSLRGVDLFGPDLVVPPGATLVEPADYEVTRILAGIPRMGAELTERTIPAETGLVARTVSFTKGCFTGQELVARIDSRGSNVPRHLRLLRTTGPIEVGAELAAGDKVAGSVTSVARTEQEGWVGLGYVARSVTPPAAVSGPHGVEVMVEELS
ncbi:MAG: folate-binding protein YgfZ [Acidimicrobiaceae bacterium]|nr:folate-binding protein YgfZ [Acidimicrobiaceae bacterium]